MKLGYGWSFFAIAVIIVFLVVVDVVGSAKYREECYKAGGVIESVARGSACFKSNSRIM